MMVFVWQANVHRQEHWQDEEDLQALAHTRGHCYHRAAGTWLFASLSPSTARSRLLLQDSIFPADGPVPLDATAARVSFSPTSLTVGPGQTRTVTVTIAPPQGLSAQSFPVFSGFIELANTAAGASESYQVTYLGLGAALRDMPVLDNTNVFFGVALPTMVDGAGNFFASPEDFTFVGADFPSVLLRLNFGTPKLRFDLVDADIKLNTTLNPRAAVETEGEEARTHVFERNVFSFPHNPSQGTFAQVKILGPLFEADFQPRNSDVDVSVSLCWLMPHALKVEPC